MDVKGISINNFQLGEIVEFDILLQNLWNQPVKDVFAEVIVSDASRITSEFKTSSESVLPLSQATLKGYWNTRNVPVGDYTMDVLLHYGNKISKTPFNVSVSLNDVKVSTIGKIISSKETGGLNFSNGMIVIIFIVSILVNVFLFFSIRKIMKKKK